MSNKKPNVIVICADDLGYGDISCYGTNELATPNIDKLIDDGIRFTSGYSTSAVCTPARFSLLTGQYPFRNPETNILPGDAKCIITKEQNTLPKIFKKAGYNTAVIGKWHLGLSDGSIDFNSTVDHTPNDVGFDYSFIFPATNDRVPCVYMRNRNVVNLDPNDPISVKYIYTKESPYEGIDTYKNNPEKLRCFSSHGHDGSLVNGYGRIGYMKGGTKALWKDEDLAEDFLSEIKGFINQNENSPFFLFYTPHQPHVPRVPNEKFRGKSKLGARGDVILELDWCVGELSKFLEEKNLSEDTIVIFTSDNGPVINDGYCDNALSLLGVHKPAGPLRGGKYSKFEGGARVPFIVSWKNHLKKQSSDLVVSQVDFVASFAAMVGVDVPENDSQDSQNMLDVLLGTATDGRENIVFSNAQRRPVIRAGKWAYIPPSEGVKYSPNTHTETGNSLDPQLYNLSFDIGEQQNLADTYPEIVKELAEKLEKITNS